jgi:hypothetical protein
VICSSGIGFDPMLDGQRLTFGFEGIWQGTAVLYDRQTRSLWMHHTGECFEGKLAGRSLTPLDSGRHTTWGAWRRDHPTTDAMAPDPRFKMGYFARSQSRSGDPLLPPTFPETIQSRDPRLPLETLLLGVRVGGHARAYPYVRLAKGAGVVEEPLGDVPLTVWYDPAQRSAAAFDARSDGKTLHFTRTEQAGATRFRDGETGTLWDLEGRAVSGPGAGKRLTRPTQLLTEWYGWFAHFPATTIWSH